MLGHLVFGRYGAESREDDHHTRGHSGQHGWLERLLSALRRRQSH